MTGPRAWRGAQIIETQSLRPESGGAPLFEGYEHGGAAVSCFLVTAAPGRGVSLHRHAYDEVFVLLEGQARVWVDGEQIEAHGGQILVVAAGAAHKFINSGSGPLKSVNIQPSGRVVTEWLEEEAT
jgi:mannose-6-phosphate isomerase-like protein (cupin superfamily)